MAELEQAGRARRDRILQSRQERLEKITGKRAQQENPIEFLPELTTLHGSTPRAKTEESKKEKTSKYIDREITLVSALCALLVYLCDHYASSSAVGFFDFYEKLRVSHRSGLPQTFMIFRSNPLVFLIFYGISSSSKALVNNKSIFTIFAREFVLYHFLLILIYATFLELLRRL